jgi:DNA-binding protein Fis
MFLVKNDIIRAKYDNMESLERILWISNDNKNCIMIQMNVDKLIFNTKSINEIEKLFHEGICTLYKDSIDITKSMDTNLTPIAIAYRDKAYEAIKYIFDQDDEITIFTNSKRRSQIIKNTSKKFNLTVSVLYKYLRLFLQGGKLKNALLPKYDLCGSKGNVKNNIKKSGRKSYEEIITDKTRGVVIDDTIRTKFRMAINRYYKKNNSRTLTQTYELMIQDLFSEIIKGEIIVYDEDKIPTFRQFSYFYYNNRNLEDILRARKGNKKFDLTMRPLLSNSTTEAFAPGFRYQIDATMADVYLINRIDGKSVIGRPILYLIVDVFSRLIVGFFIGLEGPSWNGSASALYNCMEDKVEVCKKYGVEICDEQWPTTSLPEVILADRGELVGPIGERIVELLNVGLEHTPSFRGDAKGIIERNFKSVNDNIKHWSPGAVKKDFRERGERRYELDAKLNIEDFTKLILYSIIERNNKALEGYPLNEEMIKDNVEPIPVEIWKWGMKNRTGKLHNHSEDLIKASLLRSGKAVITEKGIRFEKEFYLANNSNEKEKYIKARVIGKEKVDILYDNRDMSVIYMMDYDEKKLIPYFLKKENQLFLNKTFEEVVDFHYVKRANFVSLKHRNLVNKVKMNHAIKGVVTNVEKRNSSEVNVKDIKLNRKIENATLRKEQALSKYTNSDNNLFKPKQEINEVNSKQKYIEFIKMMKSGEAV